VAHLIEDLDGYLCELGAAQIRDGLHILGRMPDAQQLPDMLVALTRLPNQDLPGLQEEVARLFGLSLDMLLEHKGRRLNIDDALARTPVAPSSPAPMRWRPSTPCACR
jgi:cobaltochelatase CobN